MATKITGLRYHHIMYRSPYRIPYIMLKAKGTINTSLMCQNLISPESS